MSSSHQKSGRHFCRLFFFFESSLSDCRWIWYTSITSDLRRCPLHVTQFISGHRHHPLVTSSILFQSKPHPKDKPIQLPKIQDFPFLFFHSPPLIPLTFFNQIWSKLCQTHWRDTRNLGIKSHLKKFTDTH